MPSGYSSKLQENALTKCDQCDCLILSDSSNSKNDKCIKPSELNFGYKNRSSQLTAASETNKSSQLSSGEVESICSGTEGVVLRADRPSNVRIVVNAKLDRCCSCHDVSSNEKATSSESDNSNIVKTDGTMKKICFRFCRQKKHDKNMGTDPSQEKMDEKNHTPSVAVSEVKNRNSQHHDFEPNINDLIHKFCNCYKGGGGGGCGGGCNTNTIIFPRDKICGDNLSCLENCIKAEARNNTRNLEEILNEIYKQRREIRELRDLLDLILRTMREQMCTTAIQNNKKAYQDVLDEFCRKTCLERKSNSLSITSSEKESKKAPASEKESKKATAPEVVHAVAAPPPLEEAPTPPPKPKKKGFFSWCK